MNYPRVPFSQALSRLSFHSSIHSFTVMTSVNLSNKATSRIVKAQHQSHHRAVICDSIECNVKPFTFFISLYNTEKAEILAILIMLTQKP